MSYWFNNPLIKMLLPLASASAIKGLSLSITTPKIYIGYNIFGAGIGGSSIDSIGAKCPNKRAFIVTDNFSVRFVPPVKDALENGGFITEIWDKALPEAPMDNVAESGEAMKLFEPDLIVAIGGGSVMDGAKAAWILYEKPEITDLGLVSPIEPLGLREKAILVAVPTTSGTGSECTSTAVVSDDANKRKIPLNHPDLLPDFAMLNPEFTHTMPPKLTVGSGLDALAHSMDSIFSSSSQDFSDAINIKAIQMVLDYLPRAYQNGKDREARYRMQFASSLAGIGFGSGGCALTHSFGHSIGSLFNIHHGLAVGFYIPYVFQFYKKVSEKYIKLCDALKIEGISNEIRFNGLIKMIRTFFRKLEVPLSLKEMGIPHDEFEENMDKLKLYTVEDIDSFFSPRPMTLEECEKILRYSYEGRDVDF